MGWTWEILKKGMVDKRLEIIVGIYCDSPPVEIQRHYSFDLAADCSKAAIEAGVKAEVKRVGDLYLREKDLDQYMGQVFPVVL